ncbi:MAG: class I SAM-dependent methyltransferase [Halioglobus sp.]
MDAKQTNKIESLRKSPPDAFIDNQFNQCPEKILSYLPAQGMDAKRVVDFGCGHGLKALSVALQRPEIEVIGVDVTQAFERATVFAIKHLGLAGIPENLRFHQISPGQSLGALGSLDFIYSWSVFEHIDMSLLTQIANDMFDSLSDEGHVFCQIAPLYYSPYGSHLRDFVDEPWAHLSLSHSALRALVEDAENPALDQGEKNKRRWMFGQYEALNKLTAKQLESIFLDAGFTFLEKTVKSVRLRPDNPLTHVYQSSPLLENELFYFVEKSSGRARGGFSLRPWRRRA